MTPAIRVENLSKRYKLGGPKTRNRLGDNLTQFLSNPAAYFIKHVNHPTEILWALKDISFTVQTGEVVGVIGANGAGKSTLLKVLSRITKPTSGQAMVKGRIGALLEVGTGFHPELTGRENVYLNGAILGMSREEIHKKFDAIVDFAGIERFIDTPVKRYSSGMELRLGFSVAAHLEPDILVVDEVLAVGDAAFQQKSLGKLNETASEGRTVIFVSHNMDLISNMCSKAFWIDKGQIREEGGAAAVVRSYLIGNKITSVTQRDLTNVPHLQSEYLAIRSIELRYCEDDSPIYETYSRFGFVVDCFLDAEVLQHCSLGFNITNVQGQRLFSSHLNQYTDYVVEKSELVRFEVNIEHLPFTPGTYYLSLFLVTGSNNIDVVEKAIQFEMVWNKHLGLAYPPRDAWGVMYIPIDWQVQQSVMENKNSHA